MYETEPAKVAVKAETPPELVDEPLVKEEKDVAQVDHELRAQKGEEKKEEETKEVISKVEKKGRKRRRR